MRVAIGAGMAAAALAALGAGAAVSKDNLPRAPQQRPESFEALVRCRAITEDRARLQCFDTAAQNLQQAAERKELVIVDRKQIRETKRSLFGLDLPRLSIFGGGDGDNDEEAVTSIDGTVAGAIQDGNGRWIVKLADGSTWAQTDNNPLALRPRAGQKVKVKRAALGSYTMSINGQPAVKAKRQL